MLILILSSISLGMLSTVAISRIYAKINRKRIVDSIIAISKVERDEGMCNMDYEWSIKYLSRNLR